MPATQCLADVVPAVLDGTEREALERLRRGEKKEG